jgi:hypothetical protein
MLCWWRCVGGVGFMRSWNAMQNKFCVWKNADWEYMYSLFTLFLCLVPNTCSPFCFKLFFDFYPSETEKIACKSLNIYNTDTYMSCTHVLQVKGYYINKS